MFERTSLKNVPKLVYWLSTVPAHTTWEATIISMRPLRTSVSQQPSPISPSIDFSLTHLTVMLLILLCSIGSVGAPFICYCWYKYFKNRHKNFFIKRRRILVVTPLAFMTFAIISLAPPLFFLPSFASHKNQYMPPLFSVQRPIEILHELDVIPEFILEIYLFSIPEAILHLVWLVLLVRVYFLYYDHGYNLAIANRKWRTIINRKQAHSNYFLKKRESKGNLRYVGSIVFFVWIFIVGADLFSAPPPFF